VQLCHIRRIKRAGIEKTTYLLSAAYAVLLCTLKALVPDASLHSLTRIVVSILFAVIVVRLTFSSQEYRKSSNLTRLGFVFLECIHCPQCGVSKSSIHRMWICIYLHGAFSVSYWRCDFSFVDSSQVSHRWMLGNL
jgi:hypothetical protein